MSHKETEREYGLPHGRATAWERTHLVEGADGLRIERRVRKSTGRPPKLKEEIEEDLIAEVQRLRAENDY